MGLMACCESIEVTFDKASGYDLMVSGVLGRFFCARMCRS